MQPYTYGIMSVAVTSDNKCVVYDSKDSRISIWNLKKKNKETVLQEQLHHNKSSSDQGS